MNQTPDPLREEVLESRWEATAGVALVIALQVTLAVVSQIKGWPLGGLRWWVWLVPVLPEVLLLASLSLTRPLHRLEQSGHRRKVALTLLAVVSAANALLLVALLKSLIGGDEKSGSELLFKALTVWATNVVVFGLAYWELDRGGPIRRRRTDAPAPDFQFPQMENPRLAEPGWHPRLFDYIYISFTNSIAFSPTDAMPLTRRMKLLMLCESATSSLTILLVAARAVNIFQ
jgi:uncharacterized membrane protein